MKKKESSRVVSSAINLMAGLFAGGVVLGALVPARVAIGVVAAVCLVSVIIYHYRHSIGAWYDEQGGE